MKLFRAVLILLRVAFSRLTNFTLLLFDRRTKRRNKSFRIFTVLDLVLDGMSVYVGATRLRYGRDCRNGLKRADSEGQN